MRKSSKTKIIYIGSALIVLTVALFNGVYLLKKYRTPKAAKFIVADATLSGTHSKITPQDVAPIPIPKATRSRGKVLRLPILMYHHIGLVPETSKRDAVRVGLTVSPEEFEKQVAWIKSQGYTSVLLNDLYLNTQGTKKLPAKPVIFTFDDGYDDVFNNAIPILKKYGYSGSFAIITEWPGWVNGSNTYATWQEIAAAHVDGEEIVCHTQNHFDGSNKKFTADFIFNNLSNCQKDITHHLGQASPILVYPYGHYTATYIEQAKKAGIEMGLTVHEGTEINLENLMEIPRVRVNANESMLAFQEKFPR